MSFGGRGRGGRTNPSWTNSVPRPWNRSRGRGFAPRAGRGGSSRAYSRYPQSAPDIIKNPLGQLITIINNAELSLEAGSRTDALTINGCKYIASYNWMNTKTPTILIPGRPPRWTPLKVPQRLEEDKKDVVYYRDPNAARFPSHPTEPAVEALLKTDPEFHTSVIDIFACGSTLGNLLRFVRSLDKSFRFDVEVIGNTVFFVRKENTPTEEIEGIHGYGHSFPEAYTSWEKDVKGSETHQRLVQYEFGGFKCVVRFECDGYLPDSAENTSAKHPESKAALDADDIAKAFEAASVDHALPVAGDSLAIKESGSEVPQHSIFDLKTRSGRFKRQIDMGDVLPVLWLKQIPNFIIAYHDGEGLFENINVRDVQADIDSWEHNNQDALHRLVVLLRKITQLAKSSESGRIEVYSPGVDRLEIHKQYGSGSTTISSPLKAAWERNSSSLVESDNEDEDDDQNGVLLEQVYDRFSDTSYVSDDDNKDYTACSADSCGLCGKCSY
ncbi:hypothetical protein CC78DRAFT_562292 [Lojkania enalia]|uniref:Geranylgeranyl pyrophosphate synthetase n=1 Tax=Lojkania enalia TaxID=147567 RepID=A0A9P4K1K7_9PLEO|nr:hypothetical protein CC78DRAFT_562292 [Didymosphaeria enalia]